MLDVLKPTAPPPQVEVVNNEISKRKTSAVVGFVNGERLLGEAAASVDGRYRNTVIARARDMLGKSADDTSLQAMLKANYLPYEISEDTKTRSVRLAMSEEESYIAEELVVRPCSALRLTFPSEHPM